MTYFLGHPVFTKLVCEALTLAYVSLFYSCSATSLKLDNILGNPIYMLWFCYDFMHSKVVLSGPTGNTVRPIICSLALLMETVCPGS